MFAKNGNVYLQIFVHELTTYVEDVWESIQCFKLKMSTFLPIAPRKDVDLHFTSMVQVQVG